LANNFPPDLLKGKMGTFRPLSRTHPNIVKMYTAFVDRMPIIEGSDALYPEALPGADMFGELVNEPKTLFIVMKRFVELQP
jgi:hypothetical protein